MLFNARCIVRREHARCASDDSHHDKTADKLRYCSEREKGEDDRGCGDSHSGVDRRGVTWGKRDEIEVVIEEARFGFHDRAIFFHPCTVSFDILFRCLRQFLHYFAVGAKCVVL